MIRPTFPSKYSNRGSKVVVPIDAYKSKYKSGRSSWEVNKIPCTTDFQGTSSGRFNADKESEEVEHQLVAAGEDDAEEDREEGEVDLGKLLLPGNEEGEDHG